MRLVRLVPWLLIGALAHAQQEGRPQPGNDPVARTLFDRMIATIHGARSLVYTSDHAFGGDNRRVPVARLRVQARKPNCFRVESWQSGGKKQGGTLIVDGTTLWVHWPGERPLFTGDDKEEWLRNRLRSYYSQRASRGHSIGHVAYLFGANMAMPILDPSVFLDPRCDSMLSNIDGVRGLGEERVDDEICDIVEVSHLRGQRLRTYWIARSDHLPRLMRQRVVLQRALEMEERWSDVRLDAELDDGLFAWSPPEGWVAWRPTTAAERLLEKGTPAPDFEGPLLDGGRARLSDLRGKIVWLVFWRSG